MFLNPKQAIDEGWLRGVPLDHVQPNAVDIRAGELYKVRKDSDFELYHEKKSHRARDKVDDTAEALWSLKSNNVYDFVSPAYVEMPDGVVGWLVTRSTLNRNGVFVLSGLYDSGFKGHINGMLYNLIGHTLIQPESRVAQFIMASSDSFGKYMGGYNTDEGQLPEQMG
jgi:deoxycytidine triphosphate deaminase